MLKDSDDLMSIVVLETGAAWPPWLVDYQRQAPNAVVIAQGRTEAPESFEARVLRRVEEAAGAGAQIRVGVIVSVDVPGQQRAPARQTIARALIQAMPVGQEAELVLAGDGEELEAARHDLIALAGALCEELGGRHVNVRVRFASGKSGVRRSVTPDAESEAAESLLSKA